MSARRGSLLRTITELNSELPGTLAADDDSNVLLKVPGGWRRTEAFTVMRASEVLFHHGPLTVTMPSPMVDYLADPQGKELVDAILARQSGRPLTTARQLQDVPPGTLLQDKDGDRLRKVGTSSVRYVQGPGKQVPCDTIGVHDAARLFAPFTVVKENTP